MILSECNWPVIDCDIHVTPSSVEVLYPYLAEHWREYISHSSFKGPTDTSYPKGAPTSARPDAFPSAGGPPGSDLALMRNQVLDPYGIEYGILSCDYAVESIHNPDSAAALCSAINDWQANEWLGQEPRLRGSVVVPSHVPMLAVDEINRVGGHPGFVQVYLPVRSEVPYGNRRFHPVYEAAVRHDLVISIHFGGSPGNPPSGAGWPSYYLEEYAGMAQVFQSQVLSIIAEGVFDRFPSLKVALVESGFTWMPALMWRLDKEWKGLRREVPWVRRAPSEYIREHMRLTTQPVDAPTDRNLMGQVIDHLGSDELLMFSTDYPHHHSDQPGKAWLEDLPDPLLRNIMLENARSFFRLS